MGERRGVTFQGILQGRQQFLEFQIFQSCVHILDADDLPLGIFADVVPCEAAEVRWPETVSCGDSLTGMLNSPLQNRLDKHQIIW